MTFDINAKHQESLQSRQCQACARIFFKTNPPSCQAFPRGIPAQIFNGYWDHTKPFPGDHGFQRAPAEAIRPLDFSK